MKFFNNFEDGIAVSSFIYFDQLVSFAGQYIVQFIKLKTFSTTAKYSHSERQFVTSVNFQNV